MNDNGNLVDEKEVLEVAFEAGHLLLENGAEIFRVEETIDRICRYFGVESEHTFVMLNGIIATTGNERERYFAKLQHIPVGSTRLNRVSEVNRLSRDIVAGHYTIDEVKIKLVEIRNMPGKTKRMQILAAGVGSACFCYLFGGNIRDSLCAFISGLILYTFILYISAPHLSKIVGTIAGSALVTTLSIIMYRIGVSYHLNQMVIGSIIPLIPGVAFTNAIRDIADGDYISGSVRMMDTLLVFFCIAMGVWVVFTIWNHWFGGVFL